MRKRIVVLIVISLVLLSGCAPLYARGTVVDKIFRPAHTETSYSRQITGVVTPISEYVAESYVIVLFDHGNTFEWTVGEETYDCLQIGDYYDQSKLAQKRSP